MSDIVYNARLGAWCHRQGGCALNGVGAALPTYSTVGAVLEQKNGSGLRLLGWTLLRTALIAPPMMAVGVPTGQAFKGSLLASLAISALTLLRVKRTADQVVAEAIAATAPAVN